MIKSGLDDIKYNEQYGEQVAESLAFWEGYDSIGEELNPYDGDEKLAKSYRTGQETAEYNLMMMFGAKTCLAKQN
jgi:hypothetical protein